MAFRDGKYLIYDIADYICWYCNDILNKTINNYKLNYILVYAISEYKKLYNINLIWDCSIECWSYGFIIPEIFYSPFYRDNWKPFATICDIKYPNDKTEENIDGNDIIFIMIVIKNMIDRTLEDLRNEMMNMKIFKDTKVEGFKNEVLEEDLAKEFKTAKYLNFK